MSLPEIGVAGIVLANGGAVPMPGGPPVQLLMVVPLAAAEYAVVRGGGAAAWLAKNVDDPAKRALLPGRWQSLLH